MMTFPIYGKIKNVPNHQPDILHHQNHVQTLAIKMVLPSVHAGDDLRLFQLRPVAASATVAPWP